MLVVPQYSKITYQASVLYYVTKSLKTMTTKISCPECKSTYNIFNLYCKLCNALHWMANFYNWMSGCPGVDEFIKNSQLQATHNYNVIEWIEYSKLHDIQLVGDGPFGRVYSAVWKCGPISCYEEEIPGDFSTHQYLPFWNIEKSEWR